MERAEESIDFTSEDLYRSQMSPAEVQRRRDWEDKVYHEMISTGGERIVNVFDKAIVVREGIFPSTAPDSILLAEAVRGEVKESDKVLDLGTGTGIQGIMAAEKGAEVVSTDVSQKCLDCAKINFERQGLGKKVETLQSDLFSSLKGKQFDLIVFNPPFRWFKPRNEMERASLDENYQNLGIFFKEAKEYLKENGRILMVFASSGDIDYFESLIDKNDYHSDIVTKKTIRYNDQYEWEYKVYKLTARL